MSAFDDEHLNAMLDAAAERGAKRALEAVGLHDEAAGNDIRDLRTLIVSWRDIKRSAMRSFVGWVTASVLGFIATAVWVKSGGISVFWKVGE
mgnify:CR=1 FL=1